MIWTLILWLGCTTTHRVGAMMDYQSAAEKERNLTRLLNIAERDPLVDDGYTRILALQQTGYLQPTNPEHIVILQQLIDHPHPEVRRTSTWALGESGRVMAWDETSQHSMKLLAESLLDSRSTLDAQYTLEAMIKTYTPHSHDITEDVELVRVLQQYHANTADPPEVFFLLTKSVQSLPVLLELLADEQSTNSNELYTINLDILRYFETNSGTLSQPQYRSLVQTTLQTELALLDTTSQALQLLSLWILASTAHQGLVQEVIAEQLVAIAPMMTGTQRLLIHTALWEMLETEAVRRYFRTMLTKQSDADVLQWLGIMSSRVDIIQQLYTIRHPTVEGK